MNLFTKPLGKDLFEKFRTKLNLQSYEVIKVSRF